MHRARATLGAGADRMRNRIASRVYELGTRHLYPHCPLYNPYINRIYLYIQYIYLPMYALCTPSIHLMYTLFIPIYMYLMNMIYHFKSSLELQLSDISLNLTERRMEILIFSYTVAYNKSFGRFFRLFYTHDNISSKSLNFRLKY